jgi:D-alanyl-D-alanine carboxypeptidase (penicillin-binding protein 5/6)
MNPQDTSANAVYEESRELLDWGFKAAPGAVRAGLERGRASHAPSHRPDSAHHGAVAAQASTTSKDASSGLARHLGAAVALLGLACVPFVLKAVRRRRRRPTR